VRNLHRVCRLEHAVRLRQVMRAADPNPMLKIMTKLEQTAERQVSDGGKLWQPEHASPAGRLAHAALAAGEPGSAAFRCELARLLGEWIAPRVRE
jgi:hypothetical protein